MSDFLSKAEGQVEESLNSQAQPGDGVEKKADGFVNEGEHPLSFSLRGML
jgi:hypothetical protein